MNAQALYERRFLERVAGRFDAVAPQEILEWAIARYRPRIVLACSFGGPTGMVALDMVMNIDRTIPVYYLDTALLFPETYDLVERVSARYGITPIAVKPTISLIEQAFLHGDKLWERDPDACCALRKVEPQREFLKKYDAWITGIRRDQSATRRETPVVQFDEQFGIAKISPLTHWDERMIWTYLRAHDVPYSALHDQGYPSAGCTPCTRAVKPGEDLRAGRWAGSDKTECGLHTVSAIKGEA
jgi:phosphoadenosine phosphosulfate reductase